MRWLAPYAKAEGHVGHYPDAGDGDEHHDHGVFKAGGRASRDDFSCDDAYDKRVQQQGR